MMIYCLGVESLVAHLFLLPSIAILAGRLHFGRSCQECPKPGFLYQEVKGLAFHIPQYIRSAEKHTSLPRTALLILCQCVQGGRKLSRRKEMHKHIHII